MKRNLVGGAKMIGGNLFYTGLLIGFFIGFMCATVIIVNQLKQNKEKEAQEKRLEEMQKAASPPKNSRTMWD